MSADLKSEITQNTIQNLIDGICFPRHIGFSVLDMANTPPLRQHVTKLPVLYILCHDSKIKIPRSNDCFNIVVTSCLHSQQVDVVWIPKSIHNSFMKYIEDMLNVSIEKFTEGHFFYL